MSAKIYNVLFLCTSNSARSIMAEAIINQAGRGRLRGFSAGNQPSGKLNPLALELLERHGFSTQHLHSKNWAEFVAPRCPAHGFRAHPVRPGQG